MQIKKAILGSLFLVPYFYLCGCTEPKYPPYPPKNATGCPNTTIQSLYKDTLENAVADIRMQMSTSDGKFSLEYALCAYGTSPYKELQTLKETSEIGIFLARASYDVIEFRVQKELEEGNTEAIAAIFRQKGGDGSEVALIMLDAKEVIPYSGNGLLIKFHEWSPHLVGEVLKILFTSRVGRENYIKQKNILEPDHYHNGEQPTYGSSGTLIPILAL